MFKYLVLFFPRGHGNKFSNLIGSLRYQDFPISSHGHSNAQVSFCPFVCKAIKVQSFFQNIFLLVKKVENKSFLFKQIFIAILKWRNSSSQLTSVRFNTAFAKHGAFVRVEVKEWKNWFERVRNKINKLFAGLGSVCIVKNCDRGGLCLAAARGQHFQDRFSIPYKVTFNTS